MPKLPNAPLFFPSISNDPETWFWKYGGNSHGLLISCDVLDHIPESEIDNKRVNQILEFSGKIILDNGAFGQSTENDPLVIYAQQLKRKPEIAIVLDSISAKHSSTASEASAIRATIKNAKKVMITNKNRLKLMAVVQGNDLRLIKSCAKKLNALNFKYLGIPLSSFSKKKQYEDAILKVLAIKKNIHKSVTLHGLGCGSRTMIALLSYFGVKYFDSSSFYKVAMRNSTYAPEQFCSIKNPHSKPECKFCLKKQKPVKTYPSRCKYNLIEVQKEIQRCRCALSENKMKEYLLDTRLTKSTTQKISHLL